MSNQPQENKDKKQDQDEKLIELDLKSLHTTDTSYLGDLPKTKCPKCSKPRRIYCQTCSLALEHTPPSVELPIKVEVWRHYAEAPGKSTSVQLGILAREGDLAVRVIDEDFGQERFLKYLCDNDDDDDSKNNKNSPISNDDGDSLNYENNRVRKVLILYPCKESKPVHEIKDLQTFEKLVVLDGSWNQCNSMLNRLLGKIGKLERKDLDELSFQAPVIGATSRQLSPGETPVSVPVRIQLQPVEIQNYATLFWRHHPFGRSFVSTVEAVYWFMVEYERAVNGGTSALNEHRYDDLLFYFKFQYELIQKSYRSRPEKRFHSKKGDYIQYNNTDSK